MPFVTGLVFTTKAMEYTPGPQLTLLSIYHKSH